VGLWIIQINSRKNLRQFHPYESPTSGISPAFFPGENANNLVFVPGAGNSVAQRRNFTKLDLTLATIILEVEWP